MQVSKFVSLSVEASFNEMLKLSSWMLVKKRCKINCMYVITFEIVLEKQFFELLVLPVFVFVVETFL